MMVRVQVTNVDALVDLRSTKNSNCTIGMKLLNNKHASIVIMEEVQTNILMAYWCLHMRIIQAFERFFTSNTRVVRTNEYYFCIVPCILVIYMS